MERFMQRRVIQEFLGNSELDDANIKHLLKEYTSRLQALITEEDMDAVKYHQGYIAALDECIKILRTNIKKSIKNEEEDDE